jgi:hypothetical protein
MEAIEDKIRELKERECFLLVELQAVRASIDVYAKAQRKGLSPSEPTHVIHPPVPEGAPPLDNLRIRDAIAVYLRWCQDNGRERITLGELETALLSSNVMTFRGTPLSQIRLGWKTICNSLGSPENKNTWIIDKHGDHFQKADTIGLRPNVSE